MSERINYNEVAPRGMKALAGVHVYASQSGLAPELLTAVYLRVSLINGCAYCIDMHSRELRELGVSNEKIALVPVWHEAGQLFDAREKAALAWAETVTRVSTTGCPRQRLRGRVGALRRKGTRGPDDRDRMMNAYNRMAISFRSVPARGDLGRDYGLRIADYGFARVRFRAQGARLITRASRAPGGSS